MQHDIVLIAPSGREQPAVLKISSTGVILATEDQDLNRFPFEVLKKWLPSNTRSKNPGPEDCLDLQISTDRGARDLRMRCVRGPEAVQAILKDLSDTVKLLVSAEDKLDEAQTEALMQAGSLLQERDSLSESKKEEAPQHLTGMSQQESMDVTAFGASDQPLTATSLHQVPHITLVPASKTILAQLQVNPSLSSTQPTSINYSNLASVSDTSAQVENVSVPPYGAIPVHIVGLPAAPAVVQVPQYHFTPSASLSGVHPVTEMSFQLLADPGMKINTMTQNNFETNTVAAASALMGPASYPPAVQQQSVQHTYLPQTAPDNAVREQAVAERAIQEQAVAEAQDAARHALEHSQALEGELVELQEQNRFLEDLVKRLSTEVTRMTAKSVDGNDREEKGTAAMGGDLKVPSSASDEGDPLPGWLRDRRLLNPLLTAYDEHVTALEQQLGDRTEGLDHLQKQVEAVVSENERLRAELEQQRMEAAASFRAASTGGGDVGAVQQRLALMLEENELLRRENDLMLTQQAGLQEELQRLHSTLEERAIEVLAAAQEGAAAARQLQAAEESERKAWAAVQDLESRLARQVTSVRGAENHALSLEEELKELHQSLSDERSGATVARNALDELRQAHAVLRAEADGMQIRGRAALEGQASLQAELVAVRDRYEAAASESQSTSRENEQLRSAMHILESRLAEFQRKDIEVYGRIKEAMEEAEEARLSRDSALLGQRELQKEVEVLRERLASVRQAARDSVYAELQQQLHASAEKLRLAQEDETKAQQEASELRSANERLQREMRSVASELDSLKEELGGSLESKSRLSYMSITAMEKFQALERERDEACQKLESMERRLDRSRRDWQLEKQALELELRDMRQKTVESDVQLTNRRNEVMGLTRQLDAASRELQAALLSRSKVDEDARMQMSAMRSERDQEIRALAAKLESTVLSCNRSVAEAERVMEAKEAMLARWKEEAQAIAGKLERALKEHKQQFSVQQSELSDMRLQCQAMQQENNVLVNEINELRAAVAQLEKIIDEGDSRGAQLGMQLMAAQGREEELQQEIKAMQSMLERARMATSNKTNSPIRQDPLMEKYKAFKKTASVVAIAGVGP
ncbi:hypothetical protein CEUSTIGMA_g7966.t1 [Chlamydomonas eustigma]|uniref:Uncharacterized protein n=1 Tax=Chlamydomonas eustigma TaxID=1157962 RepID=A0A250XBR1_9CHLO|nr:hypothetical protein CEUSTIGMA_g7966.t1 [Chlamydomonas eustigma]|eukprot:GAX80528.1 hypothetical protein CEUSTIGMA_g7966.t1 [Chlamydomonas eustigma]